jgi:nitrogen regulatory protein P-II 1
MRKVEAIIKPFTLDAVKDELEQVGVSGLTVYEVRGYGRQKGRREMYWGSEYVVDFMPKVKLEIITRDDQVEDVLEVILKHACTGKIGDGKIFVSELKEVVRIRTRERGDAAI